MDCEELRLVMDIDGRRVLVKVVLTPEHFAIYWDALLTPLQALRLIRELVTKILAIATDSQSIPQLVSTEYRDTGYREPKRCKIRC